LTGGDGYFRISVSADLGRDWKSGADVVVIRKDFPMGHSAPPSLSQIRISDMPIFSPFDARGHVRSVCDIKEGELAELSEVQREALMALLKASIETEQADAAFIEAQKAIRAAANKHTRMIAEYAEVAPARTFRDEWRATVAKLPPLRVDPKLLKAAAATTKKVEEANAALQAAVAAEVPVKKARDAARIAFGYALSTWTSVDPRPRTTADLVRENSRREIEHKMALVAQGLSPDYIEGSQSTVGPAHIDRVKAGGRGRTANFGYNRNALRGAKIPSQR
jgi:hypothetical protein